MAGLPRDPYVEMYLDTARKLILALPKGEKFMVADIQVRMREEGWKDLPEPRIWGGAHPGAQASRVRREVGHRTFACTLARRSWRDVVSRRWSAVTSYWPGTKGCIFEVWEDALIAGADAALVSRKQPLRLPPS